MDKTDIINKLRASNYSFEDKGTQVIVKLTSKLTRKTFFELYFENGNITYTKDIIKAIGLGNGKSFKMYTILNIGLGLFIIFLFAVLCIFDPYFFSNGGKYFFIMTTSIIIGLLLEFWYYNNRLTKIKKLLNLND